MGMQGFPIRGPYEGPMVSILRAINFILELYAWRLALGLGTCGSA